MTELHDDHAGAGEQIFGQIGVHFEKVMGTADHDGGLGISRDHAVV